MKSKSATTPAGKEVPTSRTYTLFDKPNLLWMIGGAVVIIIGFVLMAGGRSEDPNVFNDNEVYSTTRITIAPIIILAGLVVLIFALFRNQKTR